VSNLKFQVEHFSKERAEAFVNEMIPLGAEHWAEEGNTTAFDPNIQFYGWAWESEGFKVATARDAAGVLVGYVVFSLSDSNNDKTKTGTFMAIFLKKKNRGGGNGRGLFEFAVMIMRAMGAKRVIASAIPGTSYDRWLRLAGYKPKAVEYIHEF
jgi:GNAT superfamily N-acetyltransferase